MALPGTSWKWCGRVSSEEQDRRVARGAGPPRPERNPAGSGPGFALLVGLLTALPSYVGGALLGVGLVQVFSDNSHDRGLEAAMTGAFVAGPLAALVGFVVGAGWYRRRRGAVREASSG